MVEQRISVGNRWTRGKRLKCKRRVQTARAIREIWDWPGWLRVDRCDASGWIFRRLAGASRPHGLSLVSIEGRRFRREGGLLARCEADDTDLQDPAANGRGVWRAMAAGCVRAVQITCNRECEGCESPQQFPVVLLSHGLGGTGFEYASLIEELVSHGYVVVAIEHTYPRGRSRFGSGRWGRRTGAATTRRTWPATAPGLVEHYDDEALPGEPPARACG